MFPPFERIMPSLKQALTKSQEARSLAKGKIKKNVVIILIMWAITILSSFIFNNSSIVGTLIFLVFLATFLFIGLSIRAKNKFKNEYSRYLVGPMLKAMFDNIEPTTENPDLKGHVRYRPSNHVSSSRIASSGIAPRFDRMKGEDYLDGKIGATSFEFSEIELTDIEYTQDSKGNRKKKEKRVFKGIIFIADFHKDFEGQTFLNRKKFFDEDVWRLKFGGAFEIELEDIRFNKTFKTMTTNDIEARYILSSNLMERIMEFSEKTKDKVELSFKNSKMNIMVESYKNHFEGKLFENNDEETLKQIYTDFRLYFDIIEEFTLNRRIWSKV